MANIKDIICTVPVKNRVVDAPVTIVFDSEPVTWEPGAIRHLPEYCADWFHGKSLYRLDNITYKHQYKLAVMGKGQDESDITAADLPSREDGIIDWQNRRYTDPKTGKEFRRVAVSTQGVPVMEPRRDAADIELAAKQEAHAALVEAGVEKLASYSEAEIAAGIEELKVATPPARRGA